MVVAEPTSATATRSVLFDAGGRAWSLPSMHWPTAAPPTGSSGTGGGSCTHTGLVVAGDLVCDKENETAQSVWRLLVYDLIALHGKACGNQPLHKRLALLTSEVIGPRKAIPAVGTEMLRVRAKDCFRLKYVPYLLRQFKSKLSHQVRGLVFLESNALFKTGTSAAIAYDWYRSGHGRTIVDEVDLVAFAEANFK